MERIEVNGARIGWCCQDRGISPADLARAVGLEPDLIADAIAGHRGLTYRQLKAVADYFGRGVLFFAEPGNVEADEVHTPQFRSLANQKVDLPPRFLVLIERAERQREVYLSLRRDLGETVAPFVPPGNPQDSGAVRRWLGLRAENTFEGYRQAVERKGILVFRTNGYAGSWQINRELPLCGFSIFRRTCPIIVVRKESVEERQTFTLMHELGHLLLHRESFLDDHADLMSRTGREQEANRFAGEVLVPAIFLRAIDDAARPREVARYGQWLDVQRRQWGVSVEVILRRLLDLGRLGNDAYRSYRVWAEGQPLRVEEGGNRQYRHREPAHLFGQPFVRAVLDAMSAEHITLARASTYLDNLRISDVRKLESFLASA